MWGGGGGGERETKKQTNKNKQKERKKARSYIPILPFHFSTGAVGNPVSIYLISFYLFFYLFLFATGPLLY